MALDNGWEVMWRDKGPDRATRLAGRRVAPVESVLVECAQQKEDDQCGESGD